LGGQLAWGERGLQGYKFSRSAPRALGVSTTMEAGLPHHVWTMEELVRLLEA